MLKSHFKYLVNSRSTVYVLRVQQLLKHLWSFLTNHRPHESQYGRFFCIEFWTSLYSQTYLQYRRSLSLSLRWWSGLFTHIVSRSWLTFFLIIPVSPFSLRLASFSSLSLRSYLFLMSRISRSASSSICFFVSSYSRSCCRDSSCDCVGKSNKYHQESTFN